MALPLAVLEAPEAPPAPRPGLLDAVVGPMDMPAHALSVGAQWQSEACGHAHLYPAPCITPPYQAFTPDAADGQVSAYPFIVYASEVCTPVGTTDDEAVRRAKVRMRLGEQAMVEKALWGGGEGVTGIFETLQAAGKVTTVANASGGPAEALSLLEQQAAVAQYNGPLYVHARPRMAAYLSKNGLVRNLAKPTDYPMSFYGSRFVFGAGYSGNLPDGTAPTSTAEAMYITGRIFLWKEPDVTVLPIRDSLDRSVNQRLAVVQRGYVLGIECFTAAALVTRAS